MAKQPTKLYMMIGLPASGKSTTRDELEKVLTKRKEKFTVVCPDDIRGELCDGDVSDQSKNKEVFALAFKRLTQNLRGGTSVIFDATNVDKKSRRNVIKIGKSAKAGVIGVWQDTKKELCVKRNKARDRVVPEWVIQKMHDRFRKPDLKEGFDSIIRVDAKTNIRNVV